MKATFDLITQPWIPCIRNDGTAVELGLRDAIAQAHTLVGIHDESPPVVVSLHRLLLALLHRVYGPESVKDWRELWQAGQFDPGPLDAYFVRWRHRFDLFDAQRPFYQTPQEIGNVNPVSTLLPEAASGNNSTLFDHQTENDPVPLNYANAARAVVLAQYFSLGGGQSGIKGKNFTDSTCVRGVLFLAEGRNLFETLLLNLVPIAHNQPLKAMGGVGIPSWEMDDPLSPDRSVPLSWLDYLTWQSRRLKLIPDPTETNSVRAVYRSQGLSLNKDIDLHDFMKLYQRKGNQLALLNLRQDRALWRDSHALFRLHSDATHPPLVFHWLEHLVYIEGLLHKGKSLQCTALGLATEPGKATIYLHRSDRLPLPLAYLSDEAETYTTALERVVEAAEDAAYALRQAVSRFAYVYLAPEDDSDRKPDKNTVAQIVAHLGIERRYWSQLEIPFSRTLVAIPEKMEEAVFEWFDLLRKTAWSAFEDAIDALGDNPRAYKAAVRARSLLNVRLAEALHTQEKI